MVIHSIAFPPSINAYASTLWYWYVRPKVHQQIMCHLRRRVIAFKMRRCFWLCTYLLLSLITLVFSSSSLPGSTGRLHLVTVLYMQRFVQPDDFCNIAHPAVVGKSRSNVFINSIAFPSEIYLPYLLQSCIACGRCAKGDQLKDILLSPASSFFR